MNELPVSDLFSLFVFVWRSIERGLRDERRAPIMSGDNSAALSAPRASFVMLIIQNELRGCIGTLEAVRPLAEDVHENAYAAAFRDPRFHPLAPSEWHGLRLSLSILSLPQPLLVGSESELINTLRPGIDGVIFEYGQRRGTFLPAVWEALPQPREFVRQLKLKTGLPANFWAETLRIYRYTAASIEEDCALTGAARTYPPIPAHTPCRRTRSHCRAWPRPARHRSTPRPRDRHTIDPLFQGAHLLAGHAADWRPQSSRRGDPRLPGWRDSSSHRRDCCPRGARRAGKRRSCACCTARRKRDRRR